MALRWSAREAPARCACCGGLSHVLASTSNGIAAFTWLMLIGSLVLGVACQSVAMGAIGMLLMLAGNIVMWRRCELFPIDRKAAQSARRVGWLANGVALMAALFS